MTKRVFPAALLFGAVLTFFDIAGAHGMAPFRPKLIEDIYWRFPMYLVLCWLFFVVAAFVRSPRDPS